MIDFFKKNTSIENIRFMHMKVNAKFLPIVIKEFHDYISITDMLIHVSTYKKYQTVDVYREIWNIRHLLNEGDWEIVSLIYDLPLWFLEDCKYNLDMFKQYSKNKNITEEFVENNFHIVNENNAAHLKLCSYSFIKKHYDNIDIETASRKFKIYKKYLECIYADRIM